MPTDERHPLNYVSRPSPDAASRPRRSRMTVWCFGASWLAWLLIGYSAFDPFDDTLETWLAFFVLGPGTLCGLVLWAVARLVDSG
jgi:hypothetical protein